MEEGSLLADVLDSVVFVLKLIVANPQSSIRYDTIRDAILTCARKPT